MEKKAMHMRLDLESEDPLRDNFEELKERTGIKSNAELLRFLIRKCYCEIAKLQKGEKRC